jgi:hypothetical protein
MFAKAVLKWESWRMWVLKVKKQEKLQIPLGFLATCITRIRPICGKVPLACAHAIHLGHRTVMERMIQSRFADKVTHFICVAVPSEPKTTLVIPSRTSLCLQLVSVLHIGTANVLIKLR